ncbi:MAG: ABC transporter [Herpetosiphonaceae bacterium]|nr:MAG: ABC transporter [Herpetosiphonaceae bacterium]
MAAIEIVDLHKRFGPLEVLSGLVLRINAGEVYGLLGPNGAGKTTLIHLLLGFLRPSRGQVCVLGLKPEAVRDRVGYLPERTRYHAHFTAREYLLALGRFSDLHGPSLADRCDAVLELVELAAAADRRIGTFSKGMLQRLGIAQALLHQPDVLLIDEPTSGLDPTGQREMIDLLAELRGRGHTILMCSHQLAEVEELCDRVGILSGGRLRAEARIKDLTMIRGLTIITGDSELSDAVVFGLRTLGPGVEIVGREIHVQGDEALQRRVLRLMLDADARVVEVRPTGSGLADLYRRVIRGQLPPEPFAPPGTQDRLLDELLQKEGEP